MTLNTKIKIGSDLLEFSHEKEFRTVIYKGHSYKFLLNLILDCPQLIENKQDLFALAEVLNYFLFGDQFEVIEAIDSYIEKYWERKQKEQDSPDEDPEIALLWEGMYDVYAIIPPVIDEENEIFYCCLENRENGIPYFLAIPYPVETLQFDFELQPLPLVEEE